MEKIFYRPPAKKKDIADITIDDSRVQILGVVVDYSPGIVGDTNSLSQLIISDGTGNIKIFLDEYLDQEYKSSEKVRVFGKLIQDEDEMFGINAEIIQDMNNLDIELYNRIRELRKKYKT